jgi:hypothetical protein
MMFKQQKPGAVAAALGKRNDTSSYLIIIGKKRRE